MPENIDETRPTDAGETGAVHPTDGAAGEIPREDQGQPGGGTRRRGLWLRLLIVGWLILIVIALLGGYSGYQTGTDLRRGTQVAQNMGEIDNQFALGMDELDARACDRARQRFEWVLEQDPNHEGAIDGLARAITCMNATATPTPVTPTPTPTLTPTPDLRSSDEKFDQARAAMVSQDWDLAIMTLFALRKEDPDFMAVDVDSMLYVAFRNRGVEKILAGGELESGLYDLSQAELFGPLDAEADGYRNWARLFLIGASFYSVQDWAQAAFYLGQVAPFAPNLHDGRSGFAMDWYLDALEKYITQLDDAGEWCTAAGQMEIFVQFVGDPERFDQQLNEYRNRCEEDENG
jgi:hypothetical protein